MPAENSLPFGPFAASQALPNWNALATAIQQLQATVYGSMSSGGGPASAGRRPAALDVFLGYTTSNPPNAGPGNVTTYTDARYYVVRSVAPDPNKSSPAYDKQGSLTDNLSIKDDPFNGKMPLPQYVVATNLAEVPPGTIDTTASGKGGTHNLSDNTAVLVLGFPSRQNPLHRIYVMVPLAPTAYVEFRVALSSPTGSGTAGWAYTAKTMDGSTTLGTGLSPEMPHWGNTTSATGGMGYYDNTGTFKLSIAFEDRGNTTC